MFFIYQDLKDRVDLHKRDLDILLEKASKLSPSSSNNTINLEDVQQRFIQLEDQITERDQYYGNLLASWKTFVKKRNHFKDVLTRSSLINALKKCKTLSEVAADVDGIDVSSLIIFFVF